MIFILKLFLVPCFIGLITLAGRRFGASVAGLLSGLPIIAGPIIWFIYLEQGYAFAQQSLAALISGIVALSTFCFTYAWICTRLNWVFSLLFSLLIYFMVAWLMASLTLNVNTSAILACLGILLQIMFSPKSDGQILLVPASAAEIICRMMFAFVLVFSVTGLAQTIGEAYAGIFAAFPVAGSTIALFSHRNHSAKSAIKSLKSMMQGLLAMLACFYITALLSDEFGFSIALLLGGTVALTLQFIFMSVKNRALK